MTDKEYSALFGKLSKRRDIYLYILHYFKGDTVTANTLHIVRALKSVLLFHEQGSSILDSLVNRDSYSVSSVFQSYHYEFITLKLLLPSLDLRKIDRVYLINKPLLSAYFEAYNKNSYVELKRVLNNVAKEQYEELAKKLEELLKRM